MTSQDIKPGPNMNTHRHQRQDIIMYIPLTSPSLREQLPLSLDEQFSRFEWSFLSTLKQSLQPHQLTSQSSFSNSRVSRPREDRKDLASAAPQFSHPLLLVSSKVGVESGGWGGKKGQCTTETAVSRAGFLSPTSKLLVATALPTAFLAVIHKTIGAAHPPGSLFWQESEQLWGYLSATWPPLICRKHSQILSNPNLATSCPALAVGAAGGQQLSPCWTFFICLFSVCGHFAACISA